MRSSLADPERLLALTRSGLMDSAPEAEFDWVTRLVSRLLAVPVALVSLVDDQRQFFKSRIGLDVRETPLSHSFCRHVVCGGSPLIVVDARHDPRVAENPAVPALGVVAYLGVPLTTSDGHTVGSLCAIDHVPHEWHADDVELLTHLAQGVVSQIELRTLTARLAEEQLALRDSSEQLALTLEHAPIGMAVVASDGSFRQVNRALCEITGYPYDELLTLTFRDITHPDDLDADLEHVSGLLSGRSAEYQMEKRYVRRDGGEIWVRLSVSLVRAAGGEPRYFIAQVEDITAARETQQALARRETLLRDAQELARFGSWELDTAAGRLRWSEELCRIAGVPEGYAPTYEEFIDLVHPDDRGELRERVRAAWEGGFSDSDYRIVRPDGEIRFVHTRRFGRVDAEGHVLELWGTTQDVTERVLAERELRAARERSETIIAGMREGYALTADGRILEVNDALCRLTGFAREELVGARSPFPFEPPQLMEQTLALRERVRADEGGTFELKLMRKGGSTFDGEITAHPARNPDGKLLGFVNTIRDISEAKRHRLELEREREALQEAQRAARLGSWDYDLARDQRGKWSAEMWRLLGLEPRDSAPPLADFLAMVAPDDRDRVASRLAPAVTEEGRFEDEFGMITADGRELRVAFQAEAYRDEDGDVCTAFGTIQDITERADREAEEVAVREIAQLVAQAAGPDAVFEHVARDVCRLFKGHSGVVVRFDAPARRAVFVNSFTRDGRTLTGTELDLSGNSAPAAVYRTRRASRTGGARSTGFDPAVADIMAQIDDAVAAPITVAGRLWGCLAAGFQGGPAPPNTEERLSRFAELVGMAVANAEAWEALERDAATDPLTGLANQRTFMQRLSSEVKRAGRYRRGLSLLLLDLDRFKRVNDTYGHQAGDTVLVELGRRLCAAAREGELVARIGGEEFAWLMPETGLAGACAAGERVRRAIEGEQFEGVGTLTASSGVAEFEPGIDGEELVRRADAALYEAKDAGRNTTVRFTAR